MHDMRNDGRQGLVHGFLAYAIWGLLPVYFNLLSGVSAIEIIAHRILWSLGLILIVLLIRGELGPFVRALTTPRLVGALTASAVVIAANWLVYIYAVTNDQILAASLGYFLNPLINVLMGVTLLRERLKGVQWLAIGLAAAGVAILAAGAPETLGISLALALSFAFYGLVRKLTPISSLAGLGMETLILAIPAIGALYWIHETAGLSFGGAPDTTALLVASGVVTSVPLLLFASGARRLPMVTLGLLQYVAPTTQFALGTLVYGERMSPERWISFGLIWTGLAIFMAHALRQRRRPD